MKTSDFLCAILKKPLGQSLFTNERGAALVLVLWVTAVLIIIVAEFAYAMRIETLAVKNFKEKEQAYYLASAGVNLALAEIMNRYDLVYLDEKGSLVFARKENGKTKSMSFERSLEFGNGTIAYSISDESGKLNINTATREMVTSILKEAGVSGSEKDVIADSILDWRDEGHEFHLNGAEDDYYLSLSEPYEAKDGPFDTLEELLLVRGVSPALFYGKDKLSPELPSDTDAESENGYKSISRILTVRGKGRININTADKSVLEAALGSGKAQEIMARRGTDGYYEQGVHGGDVTSNIFMIESEGESGKVKANIRAIAERDPDTNEVRISYWNESRN